MDKQTERYPQIYLFRQRYIVGYLYTMGKLNSN